MILFFIYLTCQREKVELSCFSLVIDLIEERLPALALDVHVFYQLTGEGPYRYELVRERCISH